MQYKRISVLMLALACALAAGCVSAPEASNANAGATRKKSSGPIKIGFSMDTLKEERWQRDKDLVTERAKDLGADLIVQVANSNDSEQVKQAENMLTQGVDVLIVAPHNSEVAASIVDAAKRQGVPVISYDRLIDNPAIDLYVSHQVEKIGEMQAQYALDHAPTGNYILVKGASTDNNALLLEKGQKQILKPAIDRGDIKIIADQYAKDWNAEEALKIVENALTQANNQVVAVVASNDGTARGAVQALDAQGLAGFGKTVVTGQDADLASLQLIVEGKQTMTVYKPIKPLAYSAVESAIKLARGESVTPNASIDVKGKSVPAILQTPIPVDINNIAQTVFKDGYHTREEVCKNIPMDKCPK